MDGVMAEGKAGACLERDAGGNCAVWDGSGREFGPGADEREKSRITRAQESHVPTSSFLSGKLPIQLPSTAAGCNASRTEASSIMAMMNELIFVVEEAAEGGYTAKALGASIFTEADSLDELRTSILDAVRCHFGESERPKMVRLHLVRDEVLPV